MLGLLFRFFIIRHIHNHTSIISSEMQVELIMPTKPTFIWSKYSINNKKRFITGQHSPSCLFVFILREK